MWKKAKPYLIVASVALNTAFVATWIAYAVPERVSTPRTDQSEGQTVWCPLHRQLGVDPQQWEEIEPRLREFQAYIARQQQEIDRLRMEVIDNVASEQPDREFIREKQDEILALKREIQSRVIEHLLAEKAVLTADQQERLFEMLRRRSRCAPGPPMSGRGRHRAETRLHEQEEDPR